MGTDIYDRIYEQLKALGLTPLEAETWVELIFQISDIAKSDPDDVKGPILATIATGEMHYSALNSLQEKGVQLAGILSSLTGFGFPEVVTGGHVSSFLLKIALKQYVDDHKTRELEDSEEIGKEQDLGKKFEEFFGGKHQVANKQPISNKIEIYPNAVLIDGKQVRVRKDGVNINNYANREALMTVTLDLMPSAVTIHPQPYEETENRG